MRCPTRSRARSVPQVNEIAADLEAPQKMIRLLQGDVGSGKDGGGAAGAGPMRGGGHARSVDGADDILARQHFRTLEPLARRARHPHRPRHGREKGSAREEVLARLRSGETQIAIGTHAMFQEGVVFRDLALAVIDEQHRFGVHQRLALQAKAGAGANLLVMTATRSRARCRSLSTAISTCRGSPKSGRPQPWTPHRAGRTPQWVIDGLARAMAQGARAYWVCPLVEESEAVDKAAAEQRYAALRERFGDAVGLVCTGA